MSTWIIGDIHGCWQTLQRLLERIDWDPAGDELWLVGDLVNRGPASLEVLRWAAGHDERMTVVLGNHDLHLLAVAAGLSEPRIGDSLDGVLTAPDGAELLSWLRRRPLLHRRDARVMVHAGLWPGWSLAEAEELASACNRLLTGAHWRDFLEAAMCKPRPKWSAELEGDRRAAAALTVFTRVRVVRADGRPKLGFTGHPDQAPDGSRPWFETSAVAADERTVFFGHWAMLGFHRSDHAVCLDSGCVYGGGLTALCVDDDRVARQPTIDPVPPLEE